MKENAGAVSNAAHNLADEAQFRAEKVGAQLADWTEAHGHKLAAAWNVGGRRARNLVLTKPFLSAALVLGVGALTVYLLTRRSSVSRRSDISRSGTTTQTDRKYLAQDDNQQDVAQTISNPEAINPS